MSSNFPDPLVVTPEPDGIHWALWLPFWYVSDLAGAIEVPQGFITDFASIPRGLWNLYPPWGQYGRAAVVHDWLYWNQGTTRDLADKVLREAMGVCGCDYDTAKAFQTALELFGQHAWDSDAASKASGVNPFKDISHDTAH